LALMVSGPGEVSLKRRFSPGEEVVFSSRDDNGDPLPDGNYNYEFYVLPAFGALRSGADDEAAVAEDDSGPNVQCGSFAIIQGEMVIPVEGEGENDNARLRGDMTSCITTM